MKPVKGRKVQGEVSYLKKPRLPWGASPPTVSAGKSRRVTLR